MRVSFRVITGHAGTVKCGCVMERLTVWMGRMSITVVITPIFHIYYNLIYGFYSVPYPRLMYSKRYVVSDKYDLIRLVLALGFPHFLSPANMTDIVLIH